MTTTINTNNSNNSNNSNEELSPLFEGIRNESELRDWLMRVYFDPTKHNSLNYFKKSVTKDNVLEFISQSKNNFPQTPYSVVKIWETLPSLREGLKSVVLDEFSEKSPVYIRGEKTLAEISKAIGDVTTTMVNKISDGAALKLSAMVTALYSDNKKLAMEVDKKIENAILDTAEAFADAIQVSATPQDVLKNLCKTGFLTEKDFAIADSIELDSISELISWVRDEENPATQSELEDVFTADLKKQINIFNIAQLMVSRRIYRKIATKVMKDAGSII